jgi:hypothetical protein
LPQDLLTSSGREAGRSKKPDTELARGAIELLLQERRKTALHDAIALYAAKRADTASDLDEELEAASIEHCSRSVGRLKKAW